MAHLILRLPISPANIAIVVGAFRARRHQSGIHFVGDTRMVIDAAVVKFDDEGVAIVAHRADGC